MKKFTNPELEIQSLDVTDVIANSTCPTETFEDGDICESLWS